MEKRSQGDADECREVLQQLDVVLTSFSDDQDIYWFDYDVKLKAGSSLFEIYNPGMLLFNNLEKLGAVFGALIREGVRDHEGLFCVTADGKMEVFDEDRGWVDLVAADHFDHSEEIQSTIKVIADVARTAGGIYGPITMSRLNSGSGSMKSTCREKMRKSGILSKY